MATSSYLYFLPLEEYKLGSLLHRYYGKLSMRLVQEYGRLESKGMN